MDDPYSRLSPGEQSTVNLVDDTGTVFVDWDCSSHLGVVYDIDRIRKLQNLIYEGILQNPLQLQGGENPKRNGGSIMRKITKLNQTALAPVKRKKVAAYARVSSGKDAQLHSLSVQISYYNNYIGNRGD